MPLSVTRLNAEAVSVEFVDALIRVALADGREVQAPIASFPQDCRAEGPVVI
jgi:hypothetical protein